MPKISRDGDLAATGHGCDAVAGCKATQNSVFANGRPVLGPGDPLYPHTILVCCPARCVGHPANVNAGSTLVFAEGRPVTRVGDSADMGALIQGSFNVHAGG